MKTYKNLAAFEKRVQKTTDWDDYFSLGGRLYKLYEYGDLYNGRNYVYFVNKRKRDAIRIEYHCPTGDWKKTGRVVRRKKDRVDVVGKLSYDEKGVERAYHTTPRRTYSMN